MIKLTPFGEIVKNEIIKTNEIRKNIKINEYVIMSDHVHLIIEIMK
ncbi:MAG: hypothetical protein GX287_03050 [Fusobacteria bacterium]|nr:hypothetical protein [Fusobacteriota bacterium]